MSVRVVPVQERAKSTLERLREAARKALAVHGRDGLTTTHVAQYSGLSIGTVYRYFPDRLAVLDDVQPIPGGIDALIVRYGELEREVAELRARLGVAS